MTNSAAIGYAISTLKRLGFKKEEIATVAIVMGNQMDDMTEEEAEEVYRKS